LSNIIPDSHKQKKESQRLQLALAQASVVSSFILVAWALIGMYSTKSRATNGLRHMADWRIPNKMLRFFMGIYHSKCQIWRNHHQTRQTRSRITQILVSICSNQKKITQQEILLRVANAMIYDFTLW